ncbi:MAG: GatB/YqeY domain-containing protein [Rhodospirillaceae bacterium]|nr:GatB/YqeY domain-containing protein [Rhodospirillaceae bacterium]
MLREQINDVLKGAMKAKEPTKVSTLRLINAAIKDRDIAERTKGGVDEEGIDDDGILQLLQSMIKQRRDSIEAYKKGGRPELADREAEEIDVIQDFLPEQLSDDELAEAVNGVVDAVGAESLKEMGAVMAKLREDYAGQMDFGKASAIVKQRLGEFSQSRRLNFHLFHCSKILGQNSRWLRAKLSFCHLLCVVMHVAHHRPR